jgi:hypothetical protein
VFENRVLIVVCFMLVSWLDYSSTLMLEETCSSESSVDFYWTIKQFIEEDRTDRTI